MWMCTSERNTENEYCQNYTKSNPNPNPFLLLFKCGMQEVQRKPSSTNWRNCCMQTKKKILHNMMTMKTNFPEENTGSKLN